MAIATVSFEYRHIYDHRFGQESTYCFTLLYCDCTLLCNNVLKYLRSFGKLTLYVSAVCQLTYSTILILLILGKKIEVKQCNVVFIVFWKETTFPLWRAMDRRWNRNVISLLSSVTAEMRLPISCVNLL